MQLFEFLIRNWYIVIILYAIIYQLRYKSAKARKEEQKGARMPSFGGAEADTRNSKKQKKQAVSPFGSAHSGSGSERSLAGRSGHERTESRRSYIQSAESESEPSSYEIKSSNKQMNDNRNGLVMKSLEIQQQQLAQGIIWSEILGPPRAKKPFGRKL